MQIWSELAQALRDRLVIIGDEQSRQDPEQHTARLKEISDRITSIEERLPETTDPELRHYLQRRSYDKALDFLQV